ncbi:hypothetical protein [Methylorubrum extorquens]
MIGRVFVIAVAVAGHMLTVAPLAHANSGAATAGGSHSTIAMRSTASSAKAVSRANAFDPATTGSVGSQPRRKNEAPTIRADSIIMKGICVGCD